MRTFKDVEGKVYITGVNFDFKEEYDEEGNRSVPHIALTDGAASGKNKPYLLKSVSQETSISQATNNQGRKEEKKMKKETEGKKKEEETTTLQKEMQTLQKTVEQLSAALAVEKRVNAIATISKTIKPFGFEEELVDSVANVLVDLEEDQRLTTLKAFESFKEEITTLKAKVEELEKKEEENPLAEELTKEAGHSEKVEDEIEGMSEVEKANLEIKKATEALYGK